jgi:hypothetical protein
MSTAATTSIDRSNLVSQAPAAAVPQHRVTPVPRYDLYAGVHKGLRALMSDVLVRTGRTDPFDSREVAELAADVRLLLRLCRKHLASENKYVHGAMEKAIPGTSAEISAEHAHHEKEMALIDTELSGFEQAAPLASAAAGQRLYRRIALFVAENIVHMDAEETGHNAVLWATYTDQEIAEIEQTIVASISPEDMSAFLRWMVPAMTAPERAAMFTGMRLNAPSSVVDGILAVVRPYLSVGDWQKLCAATGPFN